MSDCTDPASAIIDAMIAVMKKLFDPKGACPPVGKGSTSVRFLAGEGAFLGEIECSQPMLWVRLNSRFRTESFPETSPTLNACGAGEVITVEIGVARCSQHGGDITLKQIAAESEISLDDTWRLNRAGCLLRAALKGERLISQEPVVPWGPEGGIIAWASLLTIEV